MEAVLFSARMDVFRCKTGRSITKRYEIGNCLWTHHLANKRPWRGTATIHRGTGTFHCAGWGVASANRNYSTWKSISLAVDHLIPLTEIEICITLLALQSYNY